MDPEDNDAVCSNRAPIVKQVRRGEYPMLNGWSNYRYVGSMIGKSSLAFGYDANHGNRIPELEGEE